MPNDDGAWDFFGPRPAPDAFARDGVEPDTLPRESVVRLLDAAIALVRAVGNVARVAEDVLAEQRDRLSRAPEAESPPHMQHDASPSRIDLTY